MRFSFFEMFIRVNYLYSVSCIILRKTVMYFICTVVYFTHINLLTLYFRPLEYWVSVLSKLRIPAQISSLICWLPAAKTQVELVGSFLFWIHIELLKLLKNYYNMRLQHERKRLKKEQPRSNTWNLSSLYHQTLKRHLFMF